MDNVSRIADNTNKVMHEEQKQSIKSSLREFDSEAELARPLDENVFELLAYYEWASGNEYLDTERYAQYNVLKFLAEQGKIDLKL